MSSEIKKQIQLEIGYVLFMDMVGYSTRLIIEQRALRDVLNQIVRSTEQFRDADAAGTLIKNPTGDGMALVFDGSPEEPVHCALEISRAFKGHPNLPLRISVHSGPVTVVVDVNDQTGVAGAGISYGAADHELRRCWAHSAFQTCRRRFGDPRGLATAFARSR